MDEVTPPQSHPQILLTTGGTDQLSFSTSSEPEPWLVKVAGKKVAWAVAKLTLAQLSAPAAIAAFQQGAAFLKPLGITIIIDQAVLEKALPGLIFMLLVAAHDFMKVKTGKRWL